MNAYLQLTRPKQWIKNGFVIAPIFFSGLFLELAAWSSIALATLAFIAASAVVYIINDLHDVAEDKTHPIKRLRPLAAGKITTWQALLAAAFCLGICLASVLLLPAKCGAMIAAYILLNILYSHVLKRVALLDVFFIASCYVLRVLVGCYALEVVVSPWIILTTFMLALFLGFGKRYHEMSLPDYVANKPNLQAYSRELLDKLVMISAGSALMAYAIYAADIAERSGDNAMIYTVAFVAFGLFRYLQTIYVFGKSGEPEQVVLTDKWQWTNMALWLLAVILILTTNH